MARSISEIQAAIIAAKEADSNLSGLTSTSRVAMWRLWVSIAATAIHMLEGLFDFLRLDIDKIILNQKAHTLRWYVKKAKEFRYGVALPPDSDTYAVVPPVDDSVLIVTYAAAVYVPAFRRIRLKVAKDDGADLGSLDGGELAALGEYMDRVKDAGVWLDVTSDTADNLKPRVKIYYDALVLTDGGSRIDGTADEPVKDAIKAFLKTLPFNGRFVYNDFVAAMEAVEGVLIAKPLTVHAQYALLPDIAITTEYRPDAGYLRLDESYFDTFVTYEAHDEI